MQVVLKAKGGLLVSAYLNKMKTGGAVALSHFERETRGWNVAVAVLSPLLLATLAIYGILENFTHR